MLQPDAAMTSRIAQIC